MAAAYSGDMTKLLVLFLALSAAGCRSETTTNVEPASSVTTVLPAGMSRVTDPAQVCMVNDQFMGTPQIPIAVEGRTYYGCCAMCKERLAKDPATRLAPDPVSGQSVDKASAIIVQDSSGKVMYFASEDTLRRYRG
jgi:YHS domain-containing protein